MIYFTAHTFKCVCHCRRVMFRVLGMYNFALTLKVRILQSLTTFTQLTAILENFLMGWLLILGLKEGLVECARQLVLSDYVSLNWKLENYYFRTAH